MLRYVLGLSRFTDRNVHCKAVSFVSLGDCLKQFKMLVSPSRWEIQWVPQLFEQLDFFHVNKSCKIECCGNKMHQVIQDMIVS